MRATLITSALIIAVCGAILHSIVSLRRQQAKEAGVTYFDPVRKALLIFAVVAGGGYALFVAIAVAGGS